MDPEDVPRQSRGLRLSAGFDYGRLSPDAALAAQEASQAISECSRTITAKSIEIGCHLATAKEAMGSRLFEEWLELDLELGFAAASRHLRLASELVYLYEAVLYLPLETLFRLVSRPTPDRLVREVRSQWKQGEKPSPRQIEQRIFAARASRADSREAMRAKRRRAYAPRRNRQTRVKGHPPPGGAR